MQRLVCLNNLSIRYVSLRIIGLLFLSIHTAFAVLDQSKLRASPEVQSPTPQTTTEISSNPQDRMSIAGGLTIPVDDGRGYPKGYAYFLWKRTGWPNPNTDFRLVFGGPVGDAEMTFRGLLSPTTDLGVGANYQAIGRLEEYNRGQIKIADRMGVNKYGGRVFVQQGIVVNYVEIAKIRATYEAGYESYYRNDDTASTFLLANSGLFQTARLNGGAGKINRSGYSPSGWDMNFSAEATFRDDWKRWGPPNLWDSPSQFQKFQLDGSYVASSFEDQKAVFKFTGGLGNGVDRLAAFKLGSGLTGLPTSLVLHGFYAQEIFAEDFALANMDYVFPILKEQELAVHLYLDGALTRRSDIPDRNAHAWAGTGTGVSIKAWWDTQWLLGYGYGINAQRGNNLGSHELFVQMGKQF